MIDWSNKIKLSIWFISNLLSLNWHDLFIFWSIFLTWLEGFFDLIGSIFDLIESIFKIFYVIGRIFYVIGRIFYLIWSIFLKPNLKYFLTWLEACFFFLIESFYLTWFKIYFWLKVQNLISFEWFEIWYNHIWSNQDHSIQLKWKYVYKLIECILNGSSVLPYMTRSPPGLGTHLGQVTVFRG